MLLVFLNLDKQEFVLRRFADETSHLLPQPSGWEAAGEVEGYLDAMQHIRVLATGYGWRDWNVKVEGVR